MKLRIRGNAIRLRLQRAEVAALARDGMLRDTLVLGPEPGEGWHYGIILTEAGRVGIRHKAGTLEVLLPRADARVLADTDRVGVEAEVAVTPDSTLRVLIEKDYQCLVDRPGEDDRDAFHNPDRGKSC
jgi:hypothetical protein